MQLLVAVINEEEKLEEILSGLLELGVTGATVLDSAGMAHVVADRVPIFAGLELLARRSRPRNQTLFTVIEDDTKVDAVIAMISEACGSLEGPGTGIVFTLPVNRVVGIAPEVGPE